MCASQCGIYSDGADKWKVRRLPILPPSPLHHPPLLLDPSPTRAPPSPQGDYLCRRNEPEYKSNLGGWVYRCRPPTTGQGPYCSSDYSLCQTQGKKAQTVRACKEKRACGRKIAKCAKKVRKKPWKQHKCLKKWGKGPDGACTNLKTQRKCPTSCGVCG